MADTLLDAHHAAREARERGATVLNPADLARIRNHYRAALARGRGDNHGERGLLAAEGRTLIQRFHRFGDHLTDRNQEN